LRAKGGNKFFQSRQDFLAQPWTLTIGSPNTHQDCQRRGNCQTDPLTNLSNKRAYQEDPRLPVQVFVDVDSLKWINDNISHEAGDELLKTVGWALDSLDCPGYRSYYISGDEFILRPKACKLHRSWTNRALRAIMPNRVQGLCVERRKPLAKRRAKDYFCTVVSENVEIALKNKPNFTSQSSKNELFVQCNQLDCQYVDLNQSPCPLRLNLFSEEIEKRGKRSQIVE
jgi:GGDEF domain-containing protein